MPMSMQEISDRLEIQDLMVRYSYAIDSRNCQPLGFGHSGRDRIHPDPAAGELAGQRFGDRVDGGLGSRVDHGVRYRIGTRNGAEIDDAAAVAMIRLQEPGPVEVSVATGLCATRK